MKKINLFLSTIPFIFSISVALANDECEEGYIYDSSQPVGSRCVTPNKLCQINNMTQPLCKIILGDQEYQLYRKTATDNCQIIVLYEKDDGNL